jgi:hypothetical protein
LDTFNNWDCYKSSDWLDVKFNVVFDREFFIYSDKVFNVWFDVEFGFNDEFDDMFYCGI